MTPVYRRSEWSIEATAVSVVTGGLQIHLDSVTSEHGERRVLPVVRSRDDLGRWAGSIWRASHLASIDLEQVVNFGRSIRSIDHC